ARMRLMQELGGLKRQRDIEASRLAAETRRLAAELQAREVRMARLEQDSATLQRLPLPRPAWLLSASGGTVRGGGGEGSRPDITLLRPVGTAVWETTPTVECRAVRGATGYQVRLETEDSTEELSAPRLVAQNRWQVRTPLRAGHVYQWAVSAHKGERS